MTHALLLLLLSALAPADASGVPDGPPLCIAASGVEVHEVQPDGKRRLTAADFLRGRRPQVGDCLGPAPGVQLPNAQDLLPGRPC